ncbi:MAG: GTP 3',8-cyclase MoaA [Xanthomonadales bacterium]|nr:GTP 3',8-cyclase MoaA [Xanthomonadales bacterium]
MDTASERTADEAADQPAPLQDRLGRPLRDLRLSVLDRCNLRCTYCMPEESLEGRGIFLPPDKLLSDDELVALVRVFVRLGVHKLRLTGGEPMLRPGLPGLVGRLAAVDGIQDLAMTTNAILLPRLAAPLKQAGLGRITVSLDSLDEAVFRRMSGGHGSVAQVLDGIRAAEEAGFTRMKINTVVQRGVNDDGVLDLVSHFRGTGHTLRLIEFMDVGNVNHWSRAQVVPSSRLLKAIHDRWPVRPVAQQSASETARRYEFLDGQGQVGFISSISEPFCGDCSRARVTADGVFYSCLFSSRGTALRPLLRQGADEDSIQALLVRLWTGRADRYSEERSADAVPEAKVEMYRMGG